MASAPRSHSWQSLPAGGSGHGRCASPPPAATCYSWWVLSVCPHASFPDTHEPCPPMPWGHGAWPQSTSWGARHAPQLHSAASSLHAPLPHIGGLWHTASGCRLGCGHRGHTPPHGQVLQPAGSAHTPHTHSLYSTLLLCTRPSPMPHSHMAMHHATPLPPAEGHKPLPLPLPPLPLTWGNTPWLSLPLPPPVYMCH